MNPALAAIAIAILAGAVGAVFARDARIAVVGLAAALVDRAVPRPIPSRPPAALSLGSSAPSWPPTSCGSRSATAASRPADRGSAGRPTPSSAAAAIVVGLSHGLGAPTTGPEFASGGRVRAGRARDRADPDRARHHPCGHRPQPAAAGRAARPGRPGRHSVARSSTHHRGPVAALGGAVAVLAMAARSDGTAGFALAEGARPPRAATRTRPPRPPSPPADGGDEPAPFLDRRLRRDGRRPGLSRPPRRLARRPRGAARRSWRPSRSARRAASRSAGTVSPPPYLRLFLILGAFTGLAPLDHRRLLPARVATGLP